MKKISGYYWLSVLLLVSHSVHASNCQGRFINPITDICWECLLPLTIGHTSVFSSSLPDTPNPETPVCSCPGNPIPQIGITLGYWEPVFLVDVTRTPFCLVNLGGIALQAGKRYQRGMVNTVAKAQNISFYQVHWYVFPIMAWLNLIGRKGCVEGSEFDLSYFSELDPTWQDSALAFILNPEVMLFANTPAQAACAADAIAASTGHLPIDQLFWCAGAQGGLYPFTGHVREHVGGVQASLLLAQRMNAKLHREGLVWDSRASSGQALCSTRPQAILPKSRYRYQMTYPIPATTSPNGCKPFGASTALWGAGREFPYKGEDFGYLFFRKRNCCAF